MDERRSDGMEFLDTGNPLTRLCNRGFAKGFAEGFAESYTGSFVEFSESFSETFIEQFSKDFAESFDESFRKRTEESARTAAYWLLKENWSVTKISQFLHRNVEQIETWAKEFGRSYQIR